MVEAPDIFVAAAQWLAARPLGCSAADAVSGTLRGLIGPPRIGVTMPHWVGVVPRWAGVDQAGRMPRGRSETAGPAQVAGGGGPGGGRVSMHGGSPEPGAGGVASIISWPVACGAAVDVVIVEQPGVLAESVRARMREGPQIFLHSQSPGETRLLTEAPVAEDALLKARSAMLAGELRALAFALERGAVGGVSRAVEVDPQRADCLALGGRKQGDEGPADQGPGIELAGQLRAIAQLYRDPDLAAREVRAKRASAGEVRAKRAGRVAIFGPDPDACAALATELSRAGVRLCAPAELPSYLLAVAPCGGWNREETLIVRATARRFPGAELLVTAALPGLELPGKDEVNPGGRGFDDPAVVPEAELAVWLRGHCPEPVGEAQWRRAAQLVRRRRARVATERLRQALAQADSLVAQRLIDQIAWDLGLDAPHASAAESRRTFWETGAVALVSGLGAAATAGRTLGPAGALLVGMVTAAVVGTLRHREYRRRRAQRTARLRAEELRARVDTELPTAGRGGGLRWLTYRGSGIIDRHG